MDPEDQAEVWFAVFVLQGAGDPVAGHEVVIVSTCI